MSGELDCMIGLVVGQPSFDDQGHCWNFPLGDDYSLAIPCPWQILAEDRVVLASGDHGQVYGLPAPVDAVEEASKRLSGRKVNSVSLASGSAELEVEVEGGATLRTFNDSSGYEGWQLMGPNGTRWVVQGGGNVVSG